MGFAITSVHGVSSALFTISFIHCHCFQIITLCWRLWTTADTLLETSLCQAQGNIPVSLRLPCAGASSAAGGRDPLRLVWNEETNRSHFSNKSVPSAHPAHSLYLRIFTAYISIPLLQVMKNKRLQVACKLSIQSSQVANHMCFFPIYSGKCLKSRNWLENSL